MSGGRTTTTTLAAEPSPNVAGSTSTVFINEIHYDNSGTDVNEGVEVAGPAGTSLSGWSLAFYNGDTNPTTGLKVYGTVTLSGTIPCQQGGYGTLNFNGPSGGIQNGAPDGIALVNSGTVVQFLSYEGAFTAADGPANGMTSTDIGVDEEPAPAAGSSLQLQNSGTTYGQFTWAEAVTATRGAVNTGQTFTATSPVCPPILSINDVSADEGNTGTTTFTFTVSLNTAAPAGGVSFTVNTANGTTNPATAGTDYVAISGGAGSIPAGGTSTTVAVTVNGDTTSESNETFFVNISAISGAQAGDTQGLGTIVNDDVAACGSTFTPIYQIQGSGTASPPGIINTAVETEGIVTGDFQAATQQSGFYIQDPAGDGNTATSDGVFVFSSSPNVSVGDRVRVRGTVIEFNTMTEIASVTSTQVCSTGNTPPTPVSYDLPEPVLNDLERVEGMLVTFPEALSVTGNNLLGRFGEVMLSSDGRLFQQNSFDRPNTPGALARAALNARRQIMLDDGQTVQNPNPIPFIGADNTLRAGDTVTGLTGVIDYGLTTTNSTTRDYRVQPTTTPTFVRANPRPAAPASVGGNLKAASSNVLNYFNGDGLGGGFPTERGATNQAEFTRQRDKIISALTTLNADVLGIIEVENDGGGAQSALQDLVNGMNAVAGAGTYVGLHSPNPGTDAIQNAIIYKPASVTPVGSQVNDVNSAWDQARPPLAQTFQHNGNGEKFTFIVNHFTSKGCSASDTGPDADAGDGQGCDNGQRQTQANRLLVFIQDRKTASGDPDVLSMGDYNAYGEEDPLFILEQDSSDTLADGAGGLFNQSKRFVPQAERYSYQFDAQFGELDHAYATKSMNNQVSGATIWHINADEPTVIDYNTEFKTQDLYAPTPFRSSDHDPLVVGLNLTSAAPQAPGSVIISEYRLRGPGGANDEFVEFYNNTGSPITVNTVDGSAGWSLVASDGQVRFTIPNTTVIPARGHYLATNSNGYSLAAYPGGHNGSTHLFSAGDVEYTLDIPDGAGLALFNTALSANFDTDHRLDAVGYSTAPALYREGAGFAGVPAGETTGIDYSFLRKLTTGLPADAGDNVADFMGIDTSRTGTSIGTNLGAPGPENRFSPIYRPAVFVNRLDQAVTANTAPNRVRKQCADAEECDPNRSALGTISLRRQVVNYTGGPVTRLRFRIREITTYTTPPPAGMADIRALSSGDITVQLTNGVTVPVQGTVVEEASPGQQPFGGGWNSTWATTGIISLGSPLPNNGAVNVQFLIGVQTGGSYNLFINVEALP